MHRLIRTALWLCAAVFFALGFSVAEAAERNITLIPGNDLPGFDYSVVKGVTIDACKQACTGDNLCRAFTYNGKAKWCFLKGNAGTPTPFAAAISGKVTSTPSVEDVAKARQAEIPFPAQDLVDTAAAYAAALPKTNPPPPGTTYEALVAAGDAAEAATNPDGALLSYKQALAILPNDPALWMKVSYPFFHADRIRTPTLFLGGDKDFNVPVAGGEQMYQSLRTLGVPTQLVIYPGEYHVLTRPSFLVDRSQRYLDWMGKYLAGEP